MQNDIIRREDKYECFKSPCSSHAQFKRGMFLTARNTHKKLIKLSMQMVGWDKSQQHF